MSGRRPAPPSVPVHMVELLAKRPELRDVFRIADEIDTWVRWSA